MRKKLSQFLHWLAFIAEPCMSEDLKLKAFDLDYLNLYNLEESCKLLDITKSRFNKMILEGYISKGRRNKKDDGDYYWTECELITGYNRFLKSRS